mmetsp:Transcript_20767/g.34765  ORF Transcript_20767/g.34765 Transcript_20767/m.34765 type:complete len:488 (+) Transcript_20767:94-1557(+)
MEDKEESFSSNRDNVARDPTMVEMLEAIRSMGATMDTLVTNVADLASRVSVLEQPAAQSSASAPFLGARGLGLGQQAQEQTPARNAVEESFYRDPLFLGATVDRQTVNPMRIRTAGRQSILERNIQHSEDAAVQLHMQARQPAYDHIKLSNVHSLAQVIKFVDEAEKYQTQHKVKLPLPSLITDTARDDIIPGAGGLTIKKFYELGDVELFKLLQEKIRPNSRLDFSTKLDGHVDFYLLKGYKPTPSDFKVFLQALRTYRQRFRKLYELLAQENESNIPPIKNKDDGVIKIFLRKIPFEYGNRVWQTMGTPQCSTVYDFFEKWDAVVNEHEQLHKGALKLKQHFGGSDWFARNQGDKINNIMGETFAEDFYGENSDVVDRDADSADAASSALSAGERIDGHDIDHWISVLSGAQPKPKETYVCLSKLINGECKKTGCTYDHNESRLNEQRRRHIELCGEQLKKSAERKSSVSLLQRSAEDEPKDESA